MARNGNGNGRLGRIIKSGDIVTVQECRAFTQTHDPTEPRLDLHVTDQNNTVLVQRLRDPERPVRVAEFVTINHGRPRTFHMISARSGS